MFLDWNKHRQTLLSTIGKFARLQPEFMKGFAKMDAGASEHGHLDAKTHELIALAVAVAINLNTGAALVYTSNALYAFDALPGK